MNIKNNRIKRIESNTEIYLNIQEDNMKEILGKSKYPNELKPLLKELEKFKQACFNYAIEEHIKKLWLERKVN